MCCLPYAHAVVSTSSHGNSGSAFFFPHKETKGNLFMFFSFLSFLGIIFQTQLYGFRNELDI